VADIRHALRLMGRSPVFTITSVLSLAIGTTASATIFGLGDASSLPTSKTGAAVRAQSKVVVENLKALLAGREPVARYDGYTACPIITGYRRLILAEFDYDLQPKETFPFDQSKERYSMWLLKKHGLPAFYWHRMLRGRG